MNGVKVERTEDAALIKSVFDDPDCRPWMRDDGTPKEWSPTIHPLMYYLTPMIEAWDEGVLSDTPIGMLLFTPVNSTTWNPHMAVLPQYRGRGTAAMKAGLDWMWKNTPARKMVAFPPVYNPRMIRVFQKCAFKVEGWSSRSVMHDGKLHDRMVMGLEKEPR